MADNSNKGVVAGGYYGAPPGANPNLKGLREAMSTTNEPKEPYTFSDLCREKGLTQTDLDLIAAHASRLLTAGPAPQQREPLLSDEKIATWSDQEALRYGGRIARAFYEDKITKGELRVVTPVAFVENENDTFHYPEKCASCGIATASMEWDEANELCEAIRARFCSGCGQPVLPKIIEA